MELIGDIPHFGKNKPYDGKEDLFQIEAMKYLGFTIKGNPLIFHTPNGGLRGKREAAKFKRMGVVAGVPDILVLKPCNGYTGAAIELKVKKGKLLLTQKVQLERLKAQGYFCAVCWNYKGLVEATKIFEHGNAKNR